MKLLPLSFCVLCFYATSVLAANDMTALDTTPPPAEGALGTNQTPPLASTKFTAPVNNAPQQTAPAAPANPAAATSAVPPNAMTAPTPARPGGAANDLPLPALNTAPAPTATTPPSAVAPTPPLPQKNMSMNNKKMVLKPADIDADLSP